MDWSNLVPIIVSSFSTALVAIAGYVYQYYQNKQDKNFQVQLSKQDIENQIKLKQFEFNQNAKSQAINNYLENLTACIYNLTDENLAKLNLSASKLYLYVSGSTRQQITNTLAVINEDSLKDRLKEILEENLDLFLHSLKDETSQS